VNNIVALIILDFKQRLLVITHKSIGIIQTARQGHFAANAVNFRE
jgi:hypothetical protein